MFKLANTATAVIDLEAAFDHRQCQLLGRWLAKKLGCAVRVHGQHVAVPSSCIATARSLIEGVYLNYQAREAA